LPKCSPLSAHAGNNRDATIKVTNLKLVLTMAYPSSYYFLFRNG
jgi:hypothetical protein